MMTSANMKKRPELIICDDVNDDSLPIDEQKRREHVKRWFDAAFKPQITVPNTIVMIDL